jgi:hypothetical protein
MTPTDAQLAKVTDSWYRRISDRLVCWARMVRVWLRNRRYFHQQLMAAYLQKRGWVVFYLEKQARFCCSDNRDCWLRIYEESLLRKHKDDHYD